MIENLVQPPASDVDQIKSVADVVLDANLHKQITIILGETSIQAIDLILSNHLDRETLANLEIIEKINLFLTVAAKEKKSIPPKLQQALKKINEILPDEKLNLSYLHRLNEQKRKRIIQVISSLVLLITFSLNSVRSAINHSQEQNPVATAEASTDPLDQKKQKELEARAEFERLFSEDLNTVVAEMGWEAFLSEYAYIYDQEVWSPEEVFQLLTVQQPRYWGGYIIDYPEVFADTVKKSEFTLADFMSSCGSEEFFMNLRNHEIQGWHTVAWTDVWSHQELIQTLKIVNPDWMKVVIRNPEFFAGNVSKEDLPMFARSLLSFEDEFFIDYFLREYPDDWEKSWSKRELLDAMIAESEAKGTIAWIIFVVEHSDFFAPELSRVEVVTIMEVAPLFSGGGASYPSESFVKFISNYYAYKLYLVVSPQEFRQLIEQHFSQEITAQILSERPELTDLENRSMEELFATGAIAYVLEHYSDWQQVHTIDEIMDFLRQSQNPDYYAFIAPHPYLFQEETFSDQEVLFLAYASVYKPVRSDLSFFLNFTGDFGWQQQIPMERLLLIGRADSRHGMSIAAIHFPELFFPYFNDEDMYYLILNGSSYMEQLDVLNSSNPIWQSVVGVEQRRSLLELMKQKERRWDEIVMMEQYFFKEILTFDEMKEIMSRGYQHELRTCELWLENMTPEQEYLFYKGLDERIFANAMIENFAIFDEFMTEDDRLVVLKYEPNSILMGYRLWKNSLPPELILDEWQQNRGEENDSYLVVTNKHIFAWAFYQRYDLRDFIKQAEANRLFDTNHQTNKYYYEEWLEFMSIEELYLTLRSFDEGRLLILAHPSLFFEFVESSDLDLFMSSDWSALQRIISTEEWQELWQPSDIYEVAKRQKVEYLATTIFYGDYKELFMPLVQEDDLRILVGSYPYNYDAGYSFAQDMPIFLEKWTAAEIFTAVQQEHPETWGDFIVQENAVPYFSELVQRDDLSDLIVHGAQPEGLVSFRLWEVSELFAAYQEHMPDSWGSIVVSNPEIFKDEVIRRNISLREMLENGGAEVMYYNIWSWDSIWTEEEIVSLLDEMGINPPEASG